METRLSNFFKTTNVTNFTKVILKTSYSVLQVTFKQETLKQPIYFLKAVEFYSTFDIQIDIILVIFREKLQNHTFQKAHRSLSKCANIHINRATHYEITALEKYEKFVFFWRFFFQNENCQHFEFSMNQIFGQRFIIFEKMRYRGQLLLKLKDVEVATLFH